MGTSRVTGPGPQNFHPEIYPRKLPRKISHSRFKSILDQIPDGESYFCLHPSVPDSLICAGSRWRQIGAFGPMRRDCARLRNSWTSKMVSKGLARFLYHKLSLNICKIILTLTIKEISALNVINLPIFQLWDRIAPNWEVKKILWRVSYRPQFLIEKRRLHLLTLFPEFYGLAQFALKV